MRAPVLPVELFRERGDLRVRVVSGGPHTLEQLGLLTETYATTQHDYNVHRKTQQAADLVL